ncbi:ATP-binding cassette sub-family E member 1-like [Toxotes jaculatrix]|uniref:ATP-binding cassette sub-family E member 1-like n=1 Tax=Toxotes jaculatrix TaxID=941984 RepID=UPI001B3B0E67|nr:ATP-binding cassette sub-family E member 1-like [Toxotes jaculatrix]
MKKAAFVVEHDFIMATYLADRVIVFDGIPSKKTAANTPQGLLAGMNRFLSLLEITFRRDPNNFRPRINKLNSIKVFTPVNSLYMSVLRCKTEEPSEICFFIIKAMHFIYPELF